MKAEYVLPLAWDKTTSEREAAGLNDYLSRLSLNVDVTVVDGSEPDVARRHTQMWNGVVRVLPPQPRPGRNGKVAGVVTGLRAARHELVVIADDDVRYTPESLNAVLEALTAGADLVCPQNVLQPLCWHSRWDTARSLVNRAFGGDYPGTLGVRRSAFLSTGGYDGDVLFENLELMRTFAAHGLAVQHLPHVYVPRLRPTVAQFLSQRVRHAYDSQAQPLRLFAELALLPYLAGAVARRSPVRLGIFVAAAVALAERGRRRAGGAAVFEPAAAAWAVPWALERAVCAWLALLARLRGGVLYRGTRVPKAAHSVRQLRRLNVSTPTTPPPEAAAFREPAGQAPSKDARLREDAAYGP
jgi:hypothetical protein